MVTPAPPRCFARVTADPGRFNEAPTGRGKARPGRR